MCMCTYINISKSNVIVDRLTRVCCGYVYENVVRKYFMAGNGTKAHVQS